GHDTERCVVPVRLATGDQHRLVGVGYAVTEHVASPFWESDLVGEGYDGDLPSTVRLDDEHPDAGRDRLIRPGKVRLRATAYAQHDLDRTVGATGRHGQHAEGAHNLVIHPVALPCSGAHRTRTGQAVSTRPAGDLSRKRHAHRTGGRFARAESDL